MRLSFLSLLVAGCAPGMTPLSTEDDVGQDTGQSFQVQGPAVSGISIQSNGFELVIEDESTVMRVQAVRGSRRSDEIMKLHPELSEFELDVRVLDADGRPFVTSIAGDDWADPTWGEDYWAADTDQVDPAQRKAEFELLAASADLIEDVDVPGFDMELIDLAEVARFNDMGRISAELSMGQMVDELDGAAPPSTTYTHYAGVYRASRWWGTYDHSGIYAVAYTGSSSSPTIYSTVMRGNHGAYPTDSSMSVYCATNWSGRSRTTLYVAPYTDNSYGSSQGGGCSTSYGLTSGYHVCNDDTHAEYGNVKNNSYSSWAVCGDSSLNTYVDSCSSI